MESNVKDPRQHLARWVPTLYFAEGVPFFAVSLLAGILYKRLGLPNDTIALYTSWLLLPWSLKPLWSPLLEMFKSQKFFVVVLELAGGICLALMALALPLPAYFSCTIALFALVAFCSSTHDIAADGLYIANLSARGQAAYAGWQGSFFNLARLFSQGGLVIMAGLMEARFGLKHAWMAIFTAMGVVLVGLSFYHSRALPDTPRLAAGDSATFVDVFTSFFKKPRILLLLIFILLYRAGEGQVVRIGPLFLLDQRSSGGLGLTTDQFGTIYGTFGTVAFIAGSVLGGYFASWLGLRRALVPLICVMNLPNLAYVYLSTALPVHAWQVAASLSLEMFGYGFGFVGVILLMMQEIAPGKYQTAHYAFANALMNLGLMIPGTVSGKLQMALGYRAFFMWVLISALPALVMARFVLRGAAAPSPAAEPAAAA
jgi:PAT family beta-lactamase induction signal transducer AmpG